VPLTAEVMLMNRSLEIRIRDGGVGQKNTVLGALGLLESTALYAWVGAADVREQMY